MNVRLVVLPLMVLVAAVAIWLWSPTQPTGALSATWRVGGTTEFRQPGNYEQLPAGTELRLSVVSDVPRHVYVFSYSAEDGTLLMFPSPDVMADLHNPLPAGRSVLPGQRDDTSLAWKTRPEVLATTCYIVVAADQPLDAIEQLLPHLRRWTNTALTTGVMDTTQPKDVELQGKARTPLPIAVLQRAADRAAQETLVNGPLHADAALPGVWSSAFFVKEERSEPPTGIKPGEPIPGLPIPITPFPGGGK